MNQTQTGYLVFLAALGMMATLLAGDVARLDHWKDAADPAFVAGFLTHIGAVIASFIGGKLIPTPDKSAMSDEGRARVASGSSDEGRA